MERKYPNQVVVIGVHSPKFENEKDPKSIEKAMHRYGRHHPVLNDSELKMWKTYAVESWPTVFVIDPEGYLYGRAAHEKLFDVLDKVTAQLIRTHRLKRTLDEKPVRFDTGEARERAKQPLFFPGKAVADPYGNRLFIADSSNNRIVITDLSGKKLAVVGSGAPGRADGPFDKATFADPQGMALHKEVLYVADRMNNLIRALDLKAKTVKTVAGTGSQGHELRRGGPALKVGLNSPWDLLVVDNQLYIAMAGHHQIWQMDLAKTVLVPFAGSGMENIMDGPRPASCFAQPSGLASDGTTLFVADSEVSAIRAIPLDGQGPVRTLVGTGLFDFGDVDGTAEKVRLQHALGVIAHMGKLYIADTYNNKIKVIDPDTRACQTFLGGDGLFNEPAGLSYADDKLYVADTNAHRIQVVDLQTKQVTTLELKGVTPPKITAP